MSERSLHADPVPFTPGPWEAITGCGSPLVFAKGPKNHPSMAGSQVRIADVRGWGWLQYLPGDGEGERMQDANARLIAAAPDMLAALRSALAETHCAPGCGFPGHTKGCWRSAAFAAIDKAEGR